MLKRLVVDLVAITINLGGLFLVYGNLLSDREC